MTHANDYVMSMSHISLNSYKRADYSRAERTLSVRKIVAIQQIVCLLNLLLFNVIFKCKINYSNARNNVQLISFQSNATGIISLGNVHCRVWEEDVSKWHLTVSLG